MRLTRTKTRKMTQNNRLAASFRDPNGFLFQVDSKLYRQVNQSYQPHYDFLISSGLYDHLVKNEMLIPHQESQIPPALPELAYHVLEPEIIQFISYPYEWSFNQLKDAALLTLDIQKTALEYGMTLKDASAYNIQFRQGRPVLIDSLSFEIYQAGQPWIAYKQFCEHFLAPLALMAHCDVRLSQLLRVYIDGIPLDLASRLLPAGTRLNFGMLSHIHLHASAQKHYSDKDPSPRTTRTGVSQMATLGLLENLQSTIRGLGWKAGGSEWVDYYDSTNYSQAGFNAKAEIVRGFLKSIQAARVWDLGANTGVFSRIAAETGAWVLSSDIDPGAVDRNYLEVKNKKEKNLLPLVIDLTNPSPAIGWENRERESFLQRGPVEAVIALALVHHLAISNNLPLETLARFFSRLGRWLIIEFIPKQDSQVKRLLQTRLDIFADYHVDGFEAAFQEYFSIRGKKPVEDSQRILYLMESNTNEK